MKTTEKWVVAGCGAVGLFLHAFCLQKLWLWFLVPLLKPPPISMPEAIGLVFLFALVANQHIPRTDEQKLELAAYQIVEPTLFLIFGAVVKAFL